jgi:hypothetical protein
VGEDEEEREEVGEGEGIAQIMYAHVNKCMKKILKRKKMSSSWGKPRETLEESYKN